MPCTHLPRQLESGRPWGSSASCFVFYWTIIAAFSRLVEAAASEEVPANEQRKSLSCVTCQLLATVLQEAVQERVEKFQHGKYGLATAVSEALDEPRLCKHWQTHKAVADKAGLSIEKMMVECTRQIGELQDDFEAALRKRVANLSDAEDALRVRESVCLKKRGKKKRALCSDGLWAEGEAPVPAERKRRADRREGVANAAHGEVFLKENAKRPGVVSLGKRALGLQYKVIRAGHGSLHPGNKDVCSIHYNGTLIDCTPQAGEEPCSGGTVWESTREKQRPASFSADIAGSFWAKILPLMVRGDYWEVYVPQALGFAGTDQPDKRPAGVGPNATLIFQVELLAIKGKDDATGAGGASAATSKEDL